MMTRTTWTPAFLFVSLIAVNARAAELDVRDPHIRSILADAPGATDQESVAALYRTIGFRSDTGRRDCFDSQLAIDTGLQVQQEILAATRAAERYQP